MTIKKKNYLYAIGRRKTANARVRFYDTADKPAGSVEINGKNVEAYFPAIIAPTVTDPIRLIAAPVKGYFTVRVVGGGQQSQAEAVRHGITRLLIQIDPTWKTVLKTRGFVKRDPRMKERKKPGLKRARRSPQWSKR